MAKNGKNCLIFVSKEPLVQKTCLTEKLFLQMILIMSRHKVHLVAPTKMVGSAQNS